MFDFIIQKMNKSLNLKEETNSIGLLDIFGF
jgi:myosin heavy subunit